MNRHNPALPQISQHNTNSSARRADGNKIRLLHFTTMSRPSKVAKLQCNTDQLSQVLVEELEYICRSELLLTLEGLQEKTKFIPLTALQNSPFLHKACRNKKITVAIMKHLLNFYPSGANFLSNDFPARKWNEAYIHCIWHALMISAPARQFH